VPAVTPDILRERRGLSLIELSVAMVVLTIVLGAVLSINLQALRLYQNVQASDLAASGVAIAVQELETDLQSCFRIPERASDHITVAQPHLQTDPITHVLAPAMPLAAGRLIRYYLADATGRKGSPGTYLWRATRDWGGLPAPTQPITLTRDSQPEAYGVTALQFTYVYDVAPRDSTVLCVDLQVQGSAKEGGTTVVRTHGTRIVLRNAAHGPPMTASDLASWRGALQ
jgi:prepilin-type N-terminal cleavage/methylation domain-containing protein